MLVFCEDCGERNIIEPDKVKAENNQYRCSDCNFLNTYQPRKQVQAVPPSPANTSADATQPKTKSNNTGISNKNILRSTKRRKHNTHEEPYQRVFQKLAVKMDIWGAYIYHFSDGLIAYDIDEELTEQSMLQIGKAFSVCSPFGHKILKKTKEIYLVLDDQVAVCRHITTNSILVIFCQNYPMQPAVASSFDQAINNLQVFI